MAKNGVCEVLVEGDHNESVRFPALGDKKIRGTLNFTRIPAATAMALTRRYGREIPGQILGFDPGRRTGYVKEPLREERHRDLREKLADRLNCDFAPEREDVSLPDDDRVATWCYWLVRLVESGHARVVRGELPDMATMPGTPRKRMFKPQPDRQERLLEGILDMMQSQGKLLEALAGKIKA